MASRANPGNSSHCRPSTKKSSNAVTKSTPHAIGGSGVVKAPMTSETPAIPKAKTSCLFENLRAFDDDRVAALVGCVLGSGGGGFIVVSLLAELRGLPDGLALGPDKQKAPHERRGLEVEVLALRPLTLGRLQSRQRD